MLDSFPLSILLLDVNRRVHFYNKSAELYLNPICDDLDQKSFYEIFTLDDDTTANLEEIIGNVLLFNFSEITDLEFVIDKGTTWIEFFFSSIKIKSDKYIQLILLDITERKLAEKIIQEENKKLRELDDLKKNMTTRASEQLKSPLSVMANASEILLNTYKDKLDPGAIKLLEIIKNGGEKSLDLVGKIEKISNYKSDNLVLNKQTENLSEIINKSLNSICESNTDLKLNNILEIPNDLYSDVDKIRLQHAIDDILMFIASNNDNREITIKLKDSNDYGQIIFQSSLNENRKSKNIQDISFSKELIELHKGHLFVDNSSITILLPLKNWKNGLIQLYIIYKSGVPLYDKSFNSNQKNRDTSLISGGIIGLMTILKAILQGDTQIKSIDHGDRTIIFDSNNNDEIIFVLIVKENMELYQTKLTSLISEFDRIYINLVNDIDNTCSDSTNWESLGELVLKYFQ